MISDHSMCLPQNVFVSQIKIVYWKLSISGTPFTDLNQIQTESDWMSENLRPGGKISGKKMFGEVKIVKIFK